MKQNTKHIKAIALFSLTSSILFCSGTTLATPVSLGNILVNGNFETGSVGTTVTDWTKNATTTAINVRNASDTINTRTGNAGFATTNSGAGTTGAVSATGTGYFSSKFAVLGDVSGVINGTGSGDISGIFSIYQDFTLAATYLGKTVVDYALNINFQGIFDGRDSAGSNANQNDLFTATLIKTGSPDNVLKSVGSNTLPNSCLGNATNSGGCPNTNSFQQVVLNASTNILGITPGNYRLEFKLNETNAGGQQFTDTAVGIDNVAVNVNANLFEPTTVINVPEPSMIDLMGLGLAIFAATQKKRIATLLS